MFKIEATCGCKSINYNYKLEREKINDIAQKTPLTLTFYYQLMYHHVNVLVYQVVNVSMYQVIDVSMY
jgi:hypothetical protein